MSRELAQAGLFLAFTCSCRAGSLRSGGPELAQELETTGYAGGQQGGRA
jgi:hypothetical protein